MASKKQVEEAIFALEGFRVEFELLDPKRALPDYEWRVMAPQRWKISDWKNERLENYRMLAKGLIVYRGDGSAVLRDMQLGNLRDGYYEAEHGPIARPGSSAPSNVVPIGRGAGAPSGRRKRRNR